ncbi:MAG TPA: hypothetical protein HA255_03275 [Methanosphaera sp.]|nr:hypothetical protein [Methanosphaera sp.]
MKKIICLLVVFSACLSLTVNVQAKQIKTDEMFNYIKKRQYKKAINLANKMPSEYKPSMKMTKKERHLIKKKLKA